MRQRSTIWSRKPSSPSDFCHLSGKRAVEDLRQCVLRQLVELDADRQRHAVAERDCFALAERREKFQKPGTGVGDSGRNDRLIALVRHAKRKDRVALRQDRRIDFSGTLRDDAERSAVLAAFLGDLGDGALAGLEAERRI